MSQSFHAFSFANNFLTVLPTTFGDGSFERQYQGDSGTPCIINYHKNYYNHYLLLLLLRHRLAIPNNSHISADHNNSVNFLVEIINSVIFVFNHVHTSPSRHLVHCLLESVDVGEHQRRVKSNDAHSETLAHSRVAVDVCHRGTVGQLAERLPFGPGKLLVENFARERFLWNFEGVMTLF